MKKVKFILCVFLLLFTGLIEITQGQGIKRKTYIVTPADVMETINDSLAELASNQIYLASFSNNNKNDLSLYLAYSLDGIKWIPSNLGASYIPEYGVARDPGIVHYNNKFWCTITPTSFGADSGFVIISSEDLITWDSVTFVNVSAVQTDITSRVYEPRFFLDSYDNSLSVYFSVSEYGTTNFSLHEIHPLDDTLSTWSTPVEVTGNLPSDIIDPTMIRINNVFHLFYKNRSGAYIEHATSNNKVSGFTVAGSGDWAGWKGMWEGPNIIKVADSHFRIYLDSIRTTHAVYYSESFDENLSTWTKPEILKTVYPYTNMAVIKTNIANVIKNRLIGDFVRDSILTYAETFPSNKLVLNSSGNEYVFRFYIDDVNGNDTYSGLSFSKAKKTFNGLFSILPKDFYSYKIYIFVKPGIYNESIIPVFNNTIAYFIDYTSDWCTGTSSLAVWSRNGESVSSTDSPVIINGGSVGQNRTFMALGDNVEYWFDAYNPDNNQRLAEMWEFNPSSAYNVTLWAGNGVRTIYMVAPKINLGNLPSYSPALTIGVLNQVNLVSPSFYGGSGTLSTSASGQGAIFFNNPLLLAQIGKPRTYTWKAGFKPKKINGCYFQDINRSIYFNNVPNNNVFFDADSMLYVDVVRSYTKTNIYVQANCKDFILNYNSDYFTLTDNSINQRIIKDLKTNTVFSYLDNGANIFLKNLPTSAPTTSGALWRDAASGNVIKVVP